MKAAAPLRAISRSFWGRLALHAIWLHGLWEVVQCSVLYDMSGVSSLSGLVLMVGATLADVALTLLLVFSALRLRPKTTGLSFLHLGLCLIGLGAGTAMLIEVGAQAAGWWRYSAAMPIISVFGWPIGVLPLLQMALLPLLCFLLASHRSQNR